MRCVARQTIVSNKAKIPETDFLDPLGRHCMKELADIRLHAQAARFAKREIVLS